MITSTVTLTAAPWKEILQFAITLFAILNPVAGATMYLYLVEDKKPTEKIRVVHKTTLAITIILFLTIWLGDAILNLFGISLAAFRIGGGLIILLIGLDMLNFIKLGSAELKLDSNKEIAVVPLAIPVIAGPGVIAVTLTEMQNTFDSFWEKVIVSLTTLGVIFLIWLTLRFSHTLAAKLGKAGVDIMAKVMGMFLAVIATQMILEGCIAVFPGWTALP